MFGSGLRVIGGTACAAALLVLLYDAAIIGRALFRGSKLAERSQAFERQPVERGQTDRGEIGSDPRLLVVGDSTAVGTGASHPRLSLAGRLASDHPELSIENRAVNGALTSDVVSQLQSSEQSGYNAVLIQTGGNDVLKFTPIERFEKQLDHLLQLASARATRVIVMTVGDLGSAPGIPWPVSIFMSRRADTIRDVIGQATERHGAIFIDFSDADMSFRENPDKYYANDGLHPADEGYAAWYRQLKKQTSLEVLWSRSGTEHAQSRSNP